MQFVPFYKLDRLRGVLASQLLSSQTTGTFQINNTTALGSQLATMPSGFQTTVTIEDEHILLSGFSVSGSTVTCTIATNGRGYNGTAAATHASDTVVEQRLNNDDMDNFNNHLNRIDDGGLLLPLNGLVPTIVSATQMTIAGDYTGTFTVGRVLIYQVSSTWYRAIVRSSSYSAPNTTINLSGDGLPGAGTIVIAGFDMTNNYRKPVDYQLIKHASAVPANFPPTGYSWIVNVSGNWISLDGTTNKYRFLAEARSTAASAAGALSLDFSAATIYDVDLTENITSVSCSGSVSDGSIQYLRFKQHASSPKTVTLGTAGKIRFSNTHRTYSMTQTVSAYDLIKFVYNATDDKFDIADIIRGIQAAPTVSSGEYTNNFGDGSNGAVVLDGTNTYATLFSKSGSTYTLLKDVFLTTLQVNSGVILEAAGFRIFASTSINNDGTIRNNGGNGTNGSGTTGGTAGAASASGSFLGGVAGVNGAGTTGASFSGNNGTASNPSVGGNGGNAGNFFTARTGGVATPTKQYPRSAMTAALLIETGSTIQSVRGGASGASGSGNAAGGGVEGASGGSGGGGGIVFLASPSITVSASGVIQANGGNAGNSSQTGGGNVDGSGGGGGGCVILVYVLLTDSGSITANGGSGGLKAGSGSGINGANGANGVVIQIQI